MSKRKKHYNIRHKHGSRFDNVIPDRKPNALLRPISSDAGASITDSPKFLFLYTAVILAAAFILKLIF